MARCNNNPREINYVKKKYTVHILKACTVHIWYYIQNLDLSGLDNF